MRKLTLLVGFSAGYVLGAQAGRERYDQIVALATKVRQRPETKHVQQSVIDLEHRAKDAVQDKVADFTAPLTTPLQL